MKINVWRRKTFGNARPERLARRAVFIVDALGERFVNTFNQEQESEKDPPKWQPPPKNCKRYEDDVLCIDRGDHGDVSVTIEHGGMDTEVLNGDRGHEGYYVSLYRFGAGWVEHINTLYDELQSKAARAKKARWMDL